MRHALLWIAALGAVSACTALVGLDPLEFGTTSGGGVMTGGSSPTGGAGGTAGGPSTGGGGAGGDAGGAGGDGGTGGGGTGGVGGVGGMGGSGGVLDGYAQAVVADTPISFWRLDDPTHAVAADFMGNHHGSYLGAPLIQQPGMVAGNDAVAFSDFNDIVDIPGPFTFAPNESFSVEAWFNTSVTDGLIVGQRDNSSGDHEGWWLAMSVGGPGVRFDRKVATNPSVAGGTFVVDDWNHIVGTYNGDTSVLYLNGTNVNDRSQTGNLTPPSVSLTIGNATGWAPMTGRVDEVAVYDYALSPAQVSAHHAAGVAAQ